MPNKMLIDATHPEETRVVVVRGNRVEEFDFETAQRKQLRGNIYLAKVTRVEPSLQAAFVEYGGNRHGFLAFSEIHPDYYQIPVADRERLIAEQQRLQAEADEEPEPHQTRVDRSDIEEVKAENLAAVAPLAQGAAPPEPEERSAAESAAPQSLVAVKDETPSEPPEPEIQAEPAQSYAVTAAESVAPPVAQPMEIASE